MSPSRDVTEPQPALMFGRFRLLEELGAGAQGRVVRAFDEATRQEVALKLLSARGPEPLARFKNEFRTLATLIHPNLVRLGELFEQNQVWAFSMELVRGASFLCWAGREAGSEAETRLRAGLVQILSALELLHANGLVHRDIKPENLRVTPEGRIVLLDFGLVVAHGPSARTTEHHLVGTVGYMAPELARGEVATSAADVYALGVVLYQALTGMLPFGEEGLFEVARSQRLRLPPAPSLLFETIASDLDEACMAMLAEEPEQRPSAETLLARLGRHRTAVRESLIVSRPELFVGRESELARLRVLRTERRGDAMRGVLIRGESGIGKSALVDEYVREVRRDVADSFIVSGRCHASEHVSYNAFDDLVDELARLLSALPAWERQPLLPPNAHRLPTLFPALARIPDIQIESAAESFFSEDRAGLFDAFVSLLALLGRRFALLLSIDDLQWADADSVQLLKSILDRDRELRLTLLLTARAEPHPDSDAPAQALYADARLSRLELAPLEERAARELAARLLEVRADSGRVSALVAEAAGSPIFLIELAQSDPRAEVTNIERVMRERIERLDAVAQRVFEVLAVAAAPLSPGVLLAAAETSIEALYGAIALLRKHRLVRDAPSGELMNYHDRVREAWVAGLSEAARRRIHASLARAFALGPQANALRAAQHWMLAGDESEAAPWLERAAARALESAVYEQAAELFRARLELGGAPLSVRERRALQLRLAEALAAAGHCSDSARVLLEALDGASSEERRELVLRAAQQLLQAGELASGQRAAALALREVGLRWHDHAASALLQLGLQRVRILSARTGLRRAPQRDAREVERQLDTIVRLTHPLAWSDSLRSMEISSRGLALALEETRSDYLPMLLAAEAVQVSLRDPSGDDGRRLLEEARSWLRRDGTCREHAYCAWAAGATAIAKTRYTEAEAHLREAERIYRLECRGQAWMHVNTRGMLLNAWIGVGRHAEFAQCAEVWIREAQTRGDAFAHAYYAVGGQGALRHVMADAPGDGLAEVERVMLPWQGSGGIHHSLRLKIVHDILSYAGGDQAYTWWNERARVAPLTPAFFAEGFAWRRADATLRAGIARDDMKLIRRADRLLKPLARAATPYVRVFSGLTAMQIALLERRRRDGEDIARAIRVDLRTQDDYRLLVYERLREALSLRASPNEAHWQPIRAWFEERGWRNPERALGFILPLAGWR